MQSVASCPTDADLEYFLLGRLDESRSLALEDHLEGCAACQGRVGGMVAEDDMVRAMRRNDVPVAARELAADLIPLLKRIEPSDATTAHGCVPTSDAVRTQRIPLALLTPSDEPGEIGRIGPYRIHDVIGAGGMGVVFRGFDARLQRVVAIKVVRRDGLDNPGMHERFIGEARAAAAVEHDHIVVVHAVETHDGVTCITMPLLQGESLDTLLKRVPNSLPLDEVLRIAREAASGLAAAHARGLVHRDIKPANLWLEAPAGRVKILDFGIAVLPGATDEAGAGISGTPGYMAPELWLGLPGDQRTDLFSLGCVLYQMATGAAPFPEVNARNAMRQALGDRPRPACELRPDLPIELVGLIDSLLARQPSDRPDSAAEVVATLRGIEQQRQAVRDRLKRRRWLVAVAGAAVFSAVVSAALSGFLGTPLVPDPVPVTFECDKDMPPFILEQAGGQQRFTPGAGVAVELPPGEYDVRLAVALPGRVLVPNRLTVVEKEPRLVKLALAGEVARHAMHSQPVTGVVIVPGGERLNIVSTSLDRTLALWEPDSAKTPRFVNLSSPGRCLAVSPDGKIAATAGGNKQPPLHLAVQLWDLQTLEPHGEPLAGHTRLITAAVFSPDGGSLLTASAEGLFLWHVDRREHRRLTDGETGATYNMKFSSDGKQILTGGDAGRVRVWDVAAGEPVRTFVASPATVRAVAFLPRGFAAAGDDGIIRIWDGDAINPRELTTDGKPVLALDVSVDGSRMVSGGADHAIRIWSVADGLERHVLHGHAKSVSAVALTKDGRHAASGSVDGSVRLWRLPF